MLHLPGARRQSLLCFVVLLLVVGSLSLVHAQDAELGFEEWDCPFPEIDGVVCGYLTVPEDRSQPDGSVVELAVAIISPVNEDADPVPVIYLEGGPGEAPLISIDAFLSEPIVEDHTLILFDQRGTGFSTPSLNCWEIEEDDGSSDTVQDCRDRLESEGVNLQMYNSAASAADVYDLVTALGYDQVNLWGISYGTKLGLTILRDYPEIVQSAVLDSVYAPETDDLQIQTYGLLDSLNLLFATCADDSVCSDAYPSLEDDFYALLEQLDNDPVTIDYDGEEVTLDSATVLQSLFLTLYDMNAIPFLPYGINLLAYAESDDDYVEGYGIISDNELPITPDEPPAVIDPVADSDLVVDYTDEYGDIADSEGMAYSVDCQEEYQLDDLDAAFSLAEDAPEPLSTYFVDGINSNVESCDTWGVETADSIEAERVESDVPTLLFAGSFDPITPVSSAESALEGLTNGTLLVFPTAGHGITFTYNDAGECAKTLMLDFLNDPSAPLDTQCIDDTGYIDFYVG
ncbi:MAG: alpha/beta fold hydrolase [Anaerolineae bacterium]